VGNFKLASSDIVLD